MATPPKPRFSVPRHPSFVLRTATLADADGLAQLHVDRWRRPYRGMMSDDFLDVAASELDDEIARGRIDRD